MNIFLYKKLKLHEGFCLVIPDIETRSFWEIVLFANLTCAFAKGRKTTIIRKTVFDES